MRSAHMRVSLVQAPAFFPGVPPNALALLSALLKKAGHETAVFDASLFVNERVRAGGERPGALISRDLNALLLKDRETAAGLLDRAAERIAALGGSVAAFSVLTDTEVWSLELAARLKKRDPGVRIVFGGGHCLRDALAFDFVRHPAVDAVALGEADLSFPALLERWRAGADGADVPGFLMKRDGRIVDTGESPVVADLDGLPYLDYEGFRMDDYNRDFIYFPASRGCVRKCAFCTHVALQKSFRTMSPARVAAEIRHQLERWRPRAHVTFTDFLVNGDVDHLARLCALLEDYRLERASDPRRFDGKDFGWSGQAILHPTMTAQLLRKMRRSGCRMLCYGLESGSQKVIDLMDKRFSVGTAERNLRDTRAAGILVSLFVIVGFPGETEEDFQMTLDFLERNVDAIDSVQVNALQIEPASIIAREPARFGVRSPIGSGVDWETVDGANTYAIRKDRLARVERTLDRLGIRGRELRSELAYRLDTIRELRTMERGGFALMGHDAS